MDFNGNTGVAAQFLRIEIFDAVCLCEGFLGQSMQIKVNFLCKDSILAGPLAIEIARCLDLAKSRGNAGIQEQLSVFFKLPMTKNSKNPEHAFHRQEEMLLEWLIDI